MKIKIQREEVFIPTWADNDKSDQPTKFNLRYLTSYEYYDALSKINNKTKQDTTKLISTSVQSIENLEVEDESGNVTEIKTAEDFIECPGLFDLYAEVAGHVVKMHNSIDKKK
jgi:hypothetical protein